MTLGADVMLAREQWIGLIICVVYGCILMMYIDIYVLGMSIEGFSWILGCIVQAWILLVI